MNGPEFYIAQRGLWWTIEKGAAGSPGYWNGKLNPDGSPILVYSSLEAAQFSTHYEAYHFALRNCPSILHDDSFRIADHQWS